MNQPAPIPSGFNPTGIESRNKTKDLEERAVHVDMLEWLNRLKANSDFARFIDFVKERSESALAKTGDVENRSAEQRGAYAQQHFAICKIANHVERQIAASNATIKAIDDRLRKV